MKSAFATLAASALAAVAFSVVAQDQPAAPAKPAMSASMPMDCPMMDKGAMGQGQKGAAQDMAMGKDMKCPAHAKEAASKPAKRKLAHDHAKFHKNQ